METGLDRKMGCRAVDDWAMTHRAADGGAMREAASVPKSAPTAPTGGGCGGSERGGAEAGDGCESDNGSTGKHGFLLQVRMFHPPGRSVASIRRFRGPACNLSQWGR